MGVVNSSASICLASGRKLLHSTHNKGFSILETVLAAGLILILLGLAVPGFNRYWEANRLSSAVQTMLSNLDRGRYRAIAGNREVVVRFQREQRSYRLFEDLDGNGLHGPSEPLLGAYSLPNQVDFSSIGLSGPPASANPRPVEDAITFSGDRFTFNPEGYCNRLGTIYLQNASGDAAAISCSMPGVGRLRRYGWHRAKGVWE